MREQFSEAGTAALTFSFAGRKFQAVFANMAGMEASRYRVEKAYLAGEKDGALKRLLIRDGKAVLKRSEILSLPERGNKIMIELM